MVSPRLPPVRCALYPTAVLTALLPAGETGVTEGMWWNSGEAALTVALRLLGRPQRARRQVIAPDFICPAVPRAIVAAGFESVLVPVDPESWFYRRSDLETVVSTDTAVVVVVGYNGMIPPLPDWFERILDRHDVPALADWAQCFGAKTPSYGRTPLAIYSFGPGKSLPAGGGGLIVPLTDAGRELLTTTSAPSRAGAVRCGVHLLRMVSQAFATSSAVWSILPESIVQSSSSSVAAEDVLAPVPAWIGRYAANAVADLSRNVADRRSVCRQFDAGLRDVEAVTLPSPELLETSSCVRYPVMLDRLDNLVRARDALVRNRLIKGSYRWDLHAAGPGGRDIAQRLLTLPTHCGNRDILNRIVDCIRTALKQ